MTIWQVWDGDFDGEWVEASYTTQALADAHVAAYPRRGLGVYPAEVLDALEPDVLARIAKRAAKAGRPRYSENQT